MSSSKVDIRSPFRDLNKTSNNNLSAMDLNSTPYGRETPKRDNKTSILENSNLTLPMNRITNKLSNNILDDLSKRPNSNWDIDQKIDSFTRNRYTNKGFSKSSLNSSIVSSSEIKFVLNCLESKISDTNLSYTLIFSTHLDSNEDSSSESFHNACDDKGPTLTIIKDRKGNKFGGFTTIDWNSNIKFEPDDLGFLFSINKSKIIPRDGGVNHFNAKSLRKFGPTFGNGHDLSISNNCTENKNSYNDLKSSYGVADQEITKYYLTDEKYFEVERYEVFKVDID